MSKTTVKLKARSLYLTPHELAAAASDRLSLILRPIVLPRWSTGIWSDFEAEADGAATTICKETGCPSTVKCLYGLVGDRLLVKEVWRTKADYPLSECIDARDFDYASTASEALSGYIRWRSPVTMPRTAVRFTMKITSVKPMQIHSLTAKDWFKTGIQIERDIESACGEIEAFQRAEECWDKANPNYSWDKNPWVWAVGVKQV